MTNREGSGDYKDDKNHEFDRDSIATDGSLGTSGGASKKPCIAIQARELFTELGVTASQHRVLMEQEGQPLSPQYANVSSILSQYLRSTAELYHATEEDCKYEQRITTAIRR